MDYHNNTDKLLEEMLGIKESLPQRPERNELIHARAVIKDPRIFEHYKTVEISKIQKLSDLPELTDVLVEMKLKKVSFETNRNLRNANDVLDIEMMHAEFEELMEKAIETIPSSSSQKMNSLILYKSIRGWNTTGITELNLHNSLSEAITKLPMAIGTLHLLKTLNLSNNGLKEFPASVRLLVNLEILNLEHNLFELIDFRHLQSSQLRELYAGHNSLKSISDDVVLLVDLELISIKNNQIRNLPNSIGNLTKLRELDMSNTQIQTLPQSFRLLKKLSVLRADICPLEDPIRLMLEKDAQAQDIVMYVQYQVSKANTELAKTWELLNANTRSHETIFGNSYIA
ncbi:hypothetical protein QQ045_010803 [Rhodiola kirilowii]